MDRVTRDERGQSLVLALMVLFVICFIGGLFVTLIASNVRRTQRSAQTMTADYLAEAGVRYAGDQLTYSLDGADWRPVPEDPKFVRWLHTQLPVDLPTANESPRPNDPDYLWLTQGYCRYNYGDGRFLLRVTYDPRMGEPTSKFLKIECVGRSGRYTKKDAEDPTLSQVKQPIRLRSERLAYKAIAITDYSRFITNRDRRPDPFTLGVPAYTQPDGLIVKPFVTQYGTEAGALGDINGDNKPDPYGGSIRVNGNLMWHGTNILWLSRTLNESVEVAGYISHVAEWDRGAPPGSPPPSPDATAVYVDPDLSSQNWRRNALRQSTDPYFDTSPDDPNADVGIYRDGVTTGDWGRVVGGKRYPRARSIQRLEPPLLDVSGPAGGLGRYREVTRNSGFWKNAKDPDTGATTWFNTGFYGWGEGLYINNRDDVQTESDLRTLRDDWMNPGGSQYWAGPYYTPPGVTIILTPYDLDGGGGSQPWTHPDMILMQSSAAGAKYQWFDPDGNVLTPAGGQLIMPYPRNGVIFAEGNIRIKGTLPPGVQLTVVSGATIYVEGNILKSTVDASGKALAELDKASAVSLLATDHVCINTTQFFGPALESQTPANWRPDMSCYAASVDRPLAFSFAFGDDAYARYETNGIPICAYVRHAADSGDNPAYMNMTVNQTGPGANANDPTNVAYGLYRFWKADWPPAPNPVPPALPDRKYIYPLADQDVFMGDGGGVPAPPAFVSLLAEPTPPEFSSAVAEQRWPIWEHRVFDLHPMPPPPAQPPSGAPYGFFGSPGATNTIGFNLDPGMAKADYLLSRFAIQPCEIRIEALMYAENGSFFVIPGEWFNPDAGDTFENFWKGGPDGRTVRRRIDPRWPLYGEPLDVEVTVLGAVSENVPAPIGDQTAWMDKWGWIPPRHGTTTDPIDETAVYHSPLDPTDPQGRPGPDQFAPIRQRGFKIVYDYKLSYPKTPNPDSTRAGDRNFDLPIRRDYLARPLAVTPKLPVSPQMLYFGEQS